MLSCGQNIVLVQQIEFPPAFTSRILCCSSKWCFTSSGSGLASHADTCEMKMVGFSRVSRLGDGLSAFCRDQQFQIETANAPLQNALTAQGKKIPRTEKKNNLSNSNSKLFEEIATLARQ